MVSDDLPIGPSVLAPGAPAYSDGLARRLVVPLALVLLLFILVFYVLFNAISVEGESMLPTLLPADHLLVTKSYTTPRRGDIVIIDSSRFDAGGEEIVKRVIGIPGDHISVTDDIATINGSVEDTSGIWVNPGYGDDFREAIVPSATVYVLGDNRPVSLDSRYIGAIPIEYIDGRVIGIYSPVTRMGPVR